MKQTIDVECESCSSTGVYHGFAEPKGVGVVCIRCNGTGCAKLAYTPFVARKRCEGIRIVQRSLGTFIGTGVGPLGKYVTYEEFFDGIMP